MEELLRQLQERIEELEKQNKVHSYAISVMKNNVELPSFLNWCVEHNLNADQADFITATCNIFADLLDSRQTEDENDDVLPIPRHLFVQKKLDHYTSTYPEIPRVLLDSPDMSFRSFDQCMRIFLSNERHGYPVAFFQTEEILYHLYEQHLYRKLTYALLVGANTEIGKSYLEMIRAE